MPGQYQWSGYLQRDLESGGLKGELHDPFGFVIYLVGTRGDGHYAITGLPGQIPEPYRIPVLDDETQS